MPVIAEETEQAPIERNPRTLAAGGLSRARSRRWQWTAQGLRRFPGRARCRILRTGRMMPRSPTLDRELWLETAKTQGGRSRASAVMRRGSRRSAKWRTNMTSETVQKRSQRLLEELADKYQGENPRIGRVAAVAKASVTSAFSSRNAFIRAERGISTVLSRRWRLEAAPSLRVMP